jgi:hypothetical protein
MKYDDASWHNNGEFPADLQPEAAATHSGMFLAWALISGLGGEYHVIDSADDLAQLRARKLTPGQYFLMVCGGQFTDEDLSAEGNAFAQAYFDLERGNYLGDYREFLVKGLDSDYHVPDSWRSFDKLRPVLDRRLANWRRGRIATHEDPWPEPPPPEAAPPEASLFQASPPELPPPPAAAPEAPPPEVPAITSPTIEIPALLEPAPEPRPAVVMPVEVPPPAALQAEQEPVPAGTPPEVPTIEIPALKQPPPAPVAVSAAPQSTPKRRAIRVRNADDLPEDIQQKIVSDFGIDETPGVLSRLAGFIGQLADTYGEAPDARILRCVVHLAAGSRKELEGACRLALADTRDVIYHAEYDKSDRQIRDLNLPFEA